MSSNPTPVLCPSARCEEGAQLLGIVQRDGTVAFTPDDIRIDAEFVRIAHLGRQPEARFRFAAPCQSKRCHQWAEGRCGVVDAVMRAVPETVAAMPAVLPNCAIRPNCRWFTQVGRAACRTCPLVITEIDAAGQPDPSRR